MISLQERANEARIAYQAFCTHSGRCIPCLEKVVIAACQGAIMEERERCAKIAEPVDETLASVIRALE